MGRPYRSGEDPSGANPAKCPANYEGRRVRGGPAEGGRGLKEQDAKQEDGPDGEEGVELAKKQLEGARCEEIGAAVPAVAGEGVELVGDCRYGLETGSLGQLGLSKMSSAGRRTRLCIYRRDDAPVQRDEKRGEEDRDQDEPGLGACLLWLVPSRRLDSVVLGCGAGFL